MEWESKVSRVKSRIEYLRVIHGLKHKEIYEAMGFSRQHYHYKYRETSALSLKSVIGVAKFFDITEQDLLHSSDEEFYNLPIIVAYLNWSDAVTKYEKLKLGKWDCEPYTKPESR